MDSLRNIHLSVKRDHTFRTDDPKAEHNDREFASLRDKIKKRDNDTCYYCGFRAKKWQEVHHIDDDHSNNNEDNLVTICPICHSCKHIGLAGLDDKGFMIYYPGITQVEINLLIKYLWVGQDSEDEEMKNICKMILDKFDKQRSIAKSKLTDEPATLGNFLLYMDEKEYNNRHAKLKNFLLIPNSLYYREQIRYWSDNVLNNTPASLWKKMAENQIIKQR